MNEINLLITVEFFKPWFERIKSLAEWDMFLKAPLEECGEICNSLKEFALSLELTGKQQKAINNAIQSLGSEKKDFCCSIFFPGRRPGRYIFCRSI